MIIGKITCVLVILNFRILRRQLCICYNGMPCLVAPVPLDQINKYEYKPSIRVHLWRILLGFGKTKRCQAVPTGETGWQRGIWRIILEGIDALRIESQEGHVSM